MTLRGGDVHVCAAQASTQADPQRKQELLDQATQIEGHWKEGGDYRVAVHTAVGALGGGVAGAIGSGTSAALMPEIGKAIDQMELPDPVKQAVGMITAGAIGAVSSGSAVGAATGFNTDVNNRQLHWTNYLKDKAGCDKNPQASGCATIEKMAGTKSQVVSFLATPVANVAANTDASGQVVSYVILDKATNEPKLIMEPAEFQAFSALSSGQQALMMNVSPQYALDFASAGIYAGAGNAAKVNESLIAAVTSPDYARDLLLGLVTIGAGELAGVKPGAVGTADATASAKPPVRTGAYEGSKVNVDETTLPATNERTLPSTQGSLTGQPEVAGPKASPEEVRGKTRQNEAAETLSQHGLDVEQLPNGNGKNSQKNPDLKINGEIADVYSPKTGNVKSVWDAVSEKANPDLGKAQQAPNVVVNLADSSLSASDVAQYFARNPVPRLTRLLIIKDGQVVVLTLGG